MRRMSDGVEAALHCALVLSGLPEDKVLAGKHLAELHGVSESYLLKHLRALTAADVIIAVPGPRGGYRLAHPPQQITLLDIVEAIDGKEPAFICREIRRRAPGKPKEPCQYKQDCFIKSRMLAAEKLWRDALRSQSVADLMQDGAQQISPVSKQVVSDYLSLHAR